MKKAILFSFVLLLSLVSHAWAQSRTIKGTVTDAQTGEGMPGVTVQLKGSTTAAPTGVTGDYEISVPAAEGTLVFTFIGYTNKEVALGSQTTINVALVPDQTQLDEVLVVAYGTAEEKSYTGSVTAVKSEAIEKMQANDVTKALAGLAPGIQVTSPSGQPGATSTVRIRGVGSVNAGSAPLYVVDGAPYSGDINAINPHDIESMTVLKDATAASLYGSRAANGVIVITTKGGSAPKEPTITFGATVGVSDFAVDDYKTVNASQMYELTWEALRNDARSDATLWKGKFASPEEYASKTVVTRLAGAGNGQQYNPFNNENGATDPEPVGLDGKIKPGLTPAWDEDWRDALYRKSVRQEYDLSVQGGTEKGNYYFSGNYLDQQGAFITSGFKRYSSRLRLNSQIRDNIKVGLSANISYTDQNAPTSSGTSFRNVVSWGRNISSIYPIYRRKNADGSPFTGPQEFDFNTQRPYGSNSNPVGTTVLDIIQGSNLTWGWNGFAEISFLKDFKYRTTLALNGDNYRGETFYNPTYGDASGTIRGRGTQSRSSYTEYTFNHILSWNKTFGVHTLDALGGFEVFNLSSNSVSTQKTGFIPVEGMTQLDNAATIVSSNSQKDRRALQSFLGQVNYGLADKYYLSASFRRDGSTRFYDEQQWGNFYSVGASWRLSEENFMKDLMWVNNAKLRASYGTSGNENLSSYYAYRGLYDTGYPDLSSPGMVVSTLENKLLTWEKQAIFNVGLDATLFKKIDVSLDYYNRESKDLLLDRPMPPSLGFVRIADNLGSMRNRGFEANITGHIVDNDNFGWSANLNAAHNTNEFTSLPQETILSGTKQFKVGQSIYDFYLEDFAGVDPATGLSMWYYDAKNAEGVVERKTTTDYSKATRYYVGNALPKVTGGFSNNLRYKGFDLAVLFNYSFGGKILNTDYSGLMSGGASAGTNWNVDILDRWQNPGDVTDIPRLGTGQSLNVNNRSSRFLTDASYVRLRNITLGYTLPASVQDRLRMKGLRVFVQGDNLVTWSKGLHGMDPEQSIDGLTNNSFPVMKTYSVGVRASF
ncbi:TonB-dependent receptor [Rufibacter immobilis]|uniref:TonB-dependent receptor n=1 Tax=Rufibacter immobilis TaxID=1348778 RepID=A0A3M9MSP8_9BACT|nr:TonB-dependent receptor [Rufibacter immobilis]RNI27748.1 TonB-dependent receptor [Rufibacter immobilis]